MIEMVRAASHQRHLEGPRYNQGRWILVPFKPLADIPQNGKVVKQRLNLCTPIPQPLGHIVILQRHRRLRLRFRDFQKRLARCLLNRGEHRL